MSAKLVSSDGIANASRRDVLKAGGRAHSRSDGVTECRGGSGHVGRRQGDGGFRNSRRTTSCASRRTTWSPSSPSIWKWGRASTRASRRSSPKSSTRAGSSCASSPRRPTSRATRTCSCACRARAAARRSRTPSIRCARPAPSRARMLVNAAAQRWKVPESEHHRPRRPRHARDLRHAPLASANWSPMPRSCPCRRK